MCMQAKKRRYIIVLVQLDPARGVVTGAQKWDLDRVESMPSDVIQGVGAHGTIVDHDQQAKRYRSLKRALQVAQSWAWYADIVRVMEVDQ